jgi:GMP synthase-like glutamine amidotransferase
MEEVSVFPFSLSNTGEILILVRRDQDLYRDLGGSVRGQWSPLHAASRLFLHNSEGLMAPANIRRLLQKQEPQPATDEDLNREVLAKFVTLPSYMSVKNVQDHFAFLLPVPYIDPEVLNTTLKTRSLHWIRVSTLFSVEEYQQFFTAFDLAILSQVNTHMLKQAVTAAEVPAMRIHHRIGIVNFETDAVWQFHFEALLMTNCLQNLYQRRDLTFSLYEYVLPPTRELEGLTATVVMAWKDKWDDSFNEILMSLHQTKKVLALGYAAVKLTELLGGRVEKSEESLPELARVNFEANYSNIPFIKQHLAGPPETQSVLFRLHNYIVSLLPEDAQVIASTLAGYPAIYLVQNALIVLGDPHLSFEFAEERLFPELKQLESLDHAVEENDLERAKGTWAHATRESLSYVRSLCEHFLV